MQEYDWCWQDQDCCDGLGCDFPPLDGGDHDHGDDDDDHYDDDDHDSQAGVCRSVRESLCAGLWEHCDVLPCCEGRSCQCWGDWVVECSCAP